jgi:hypothetical protein
MDAFQKQVAGKAHPFRACENSAVIPPAAHHVRVLVGEMPVDAGEKCGFGCKSAHVSKLLAEDK